MRKGKNIGIILILVLLLQCFPIAAVQALPKVTLQLIYDDKVHTYSEEQFFVQINGQTVQSDPPPVILFDCTMIPARAFFEMLQSDVQWDNDNRKVDINYNGNHIVLTIDSVLAQVNGQTSSMVMPAKIINDRTFIPLRFVSENLGFQVGWDGINRIASVQAPVISTPTPTPTPNISVNSIYTESFGTTFRVVITADQAITKFNAFTLDTSANPRYVVDISNAVFPSKNFSQEVNNGYIKAVRASQYQENVVRVVLDLQDDGYALWQPEGKNAIYIDFDPSTAKPSPTIVPSISPSVDPNTKPNATLNPKAANKLVVIDPGHGGSEAGATATYNGKTVLEKDITLAISLKLNTILKNAGVKTHILRTGDQTVDLYERPEIANEMGASLFVSIHCNSFTSSNAYGTETHYDNNDQSAEYGINSKQVAQIVQDELMKKLDTTDRKLKDGSKLVVLRKSNMPSVLVETAFMSNPDDLKRLMDDSFREKVAQAVASGIIRSLNESVK